MRNFHAFRVTGILCLQANVSRLVAFCVLSLCLWGWQPNYTYGQIVVEVEDIQPRLSNYTSADMLYQDLDSSYIAQRQTTQKWYHQFLSKFLPFGFLKRLLGMPFGEI